MRPHPNRLVLLAQPFAHALRVVASTHKHGNAHGCARPGKAHNDRHHEEAVGQDYSPTARDSKVH